MDHYLVSSVDLIFFLNFRVPPDFIGHLKLVSFILQFNVLKNWLE